jgi:hypothetical protein
MANFCHNCGKPTQVGWKRCPHCETSLLSLASKPEPIIQKQPTENFIPISVAVGDEDDSYLDRIAHLNINIRGLEVDIQKPVTQGETLGSALANPMAFNQNEVRPIPNNPQTVNDIMKEGEARNPKSKIHHVE